MKASTREWIKKAESDWVLAVSLMRRRKPPVRDQACFLFQQSAEKYVKARMEEAGIRIPRIHQIDSISRPGFLVPMDQ
jgi:HEPN domain-containing protein